MPKYALIISDVPEGVVKYLKRKGLDFTVYDFNPTLDLSGVEKVNNPWDAWQMCDNFIEGLVWEDYRIKPKTEHERKFGFPDGRGWNRFLCGINGEQGYSYIACPRCRDYSPKTLEGRKAVLVQISGQHERELRKLHGEIAKIKDELDRQNIKK